LRKKTIFKQAACDKYNRLNSKILIELQRDAKANKREFETRDNSTKLIGNIFVTVGMAGSCQPEKRRCQTLFRRQPFNPRQVGTDATQIRF